jgi:hypothetical protein
MVMMMMMMRRRRRRLQKAHQGLLTQFTALRLQMSHIL